VNKVVVTGARGEGFGDTARRIGHIGSVPIGPNASDADVLAAITSDFAAAVAASGAKVLSSVRVATTASIALSGEQTIDGVAVIAGDRVLVKDQSTPSANGVYAAASGAWNRAADFDQDAEVVSGSYVYVESGSQAGGWSLTTPDPITVGVTGQTWALFMRWSEGDALARPEAFGGRDAAAMTAAFDWVGARGGGTVKLFRARYESPYRAAAGEGYFDDPDLMLWDNITIEGEAMPWPNGSLDDPASMTKLQNGSIIDGSLFICGGNFSISRVGIDVDRKSVV
jgi:hypothetical protein